MSAQPVPSPAEDTAGPGQRFQGCSGVDSLRQGLHHSLKDVAVDASPVEVHRVRNPRLGLECWRSAASSGPFLSTALPAPIQRSQAMPTNAAASSSDPTLLRQRMFTSVWACQQHSGAQYVAGGWRHESRYQRLRQLDSISCRDGALHPPWGVRRGPPPPLSVKSESSPLTRAAGRGPLQQGHHPPR